MDTYVRLKIEKIKKAKNDEELAKIVNEIYENGADAGFLDCERYYYGLYL